MADLAQRAGIATGTLYRYFPTKAELFSEVFKLNSQREVDAFATAAQVGETSTARLENAIRTFAHRAIKGRRIAYALIAEPVDPRVEAERLVYRRAYARVLESLIDEGIDQGEFPRQDAGITAAALVGAMAEALVGPLSPSARHGEQREIPKAVREHLIQSIVTYCMRAAGAKDHRHDR
jgi:AcrR family transcriptional regulator